MGAVCLTGCIENTIPYPVEELEILSLRGEGFRSSIDVQRRVVTLTLDEQTDISEVEITEVELTEGAVASMELTGVFDMRSPIEVKLSLYQDYIWTIKAEQHIERYFSAAGLPAGDFVQ